MTLFDLLGETVDKVVGVLSPSAAAARLKARTVMQSSKRFYDGETKGRRGDGWRPIDAGPKEGMSGLVDLRNRSRDFVRNNGYAKKAVGGIVANTVGSGIVVQFKADNAKLRVKRNTALYNSWANTIACDFDGQNTFGGLQSLIFRSVVESGEVFVRRRTQSSDYYQKTRKAPLQLQILEPEFIDSSKDATRAGIGQAGNTIISGIEFNPEGKRVAYHIYKQHPSLSTSGRTDSVRVPAEEVIHLYRIDRPGQIRGIPWGAAISLNLRDLDLFEDAELVRRKVAACFAGFVTEAEDMEGGVDINGVPIARRPLVDRLEPGALEYLSAGESITFATPPNVTGYNEYTTSILHKIAAGFEVPYSVLTGDFSQTSFSSGRMGWLEFQRLIDSWRWSMFIPRALDPIMDWFEESAELVGFSFEGMERNYTAPRREMIDPLKEIQAMIMAVKAGLLSAPEAIKELGYDPDANLLEIAEWNKALDKDSIVLDSDPRQDPKRLLAENTITAAKIKSQNVASDKKVE